MTSSNNVTVSSYKCGFIDYQSLYQDEIPIFKIHKDDSYNCANTPVPVCIAGSVTILKR